MGIDPRIRANATVAAGGRQDGVWEAQAGRRVVRHQVQTWEGTGRWASQMNRKGLPSWTAMGRGGSTQSESPRLASLRMMRGNGAPGAGGA